MTRLTRPVAGVGVLCLAGALLTGIAVANAPAAQAATQRVQYASGGSYLVVEVLDDDLVHFETGAGTGPGTGAALFATDQVAKRDYPGPASYSQVGGTITTADLQVVVDTASLCATVYDTTRTPDLLLSTTCARNLGVAYKGLTFTKSSMQNA